MYLKSLIRYQLWDNKNSLIIFYSVIVALIVSFSLLSLFTPGNVKVGGMETASIIFIFIAGLLSFKEVFHFCLVNGISRRTQFISFISSIFPLALIMAAIDSIIRFVTSRLTYYETVFVQIYGDKYLSTASFQSYFEGLLWMVFIYAMFASLGYLIALVYYRSNKIMKLIVSIGPPIFLLIVLPIVGSMLRINILAWLSEFLLKFIGRYNTINPYIAVFSSLLTFIVLSLFSYLLINRAQVKD